MDISTKEELRTLIAKHSITREEILALFPDGVASAHSRWNFSHVLYYIGALIVIMGIAILVGQNWDSLSSFARIGVTLGFSVLAQLIAISFSKQGELRRISDVAYLISAALMPLGLGVTFHEFNYSVSELSTQVLMATISFGVYMAFAYLYARPILGFFATIFGTWLFFSLTSYLVSGRPYFDRAHFSEYRVLAVGITYMLLAYSARSELLKKLSGFLYFAGSAGFLAAALSLGGFKPTQDMFWELIFPLLAFSIMYAGVYLKRSSLLVLSGLYIMGYILKITFEYFTDSLGWPLALVLAGLALIAVGYGMVVVNQRYMRAS